MLETKVQELKLERGDDQKDIKERSVEIEKRLMEYEKVVGRLEDLELSLREEETTQEKEDESKWGIKNNLRRKQTRRKAMQVNRRLNYPNS